MTEPRDQERPEASSGLYDTDLNRKAIVITGVALAVGTAVVFVLMWGLNLGLKNLEEAKDPPQSPIPEARNPPPPPEPRLQEDPEADLARLRAEEDSLLQGYAWVDPQAGTVRIPIDEAMDLLAETGLPVAEDVDQATEEIFGDTATQATD